MEQILKIFTSQDEVEIKQSFKEIIIEQFKSDLENNQNYLFDPNDIEEMIREAFEEIVNEIKEEYKEKLREKMFSLVDKDIEKMIKSKR